jgi:hypothetical protein
VLGVVTAAVGLGGLAAVEAQTSAGVTPDADGFIPRASIIEIMDAMIMSSADVLWNAVGVSVTENGIIENKPETDEDWARLRYSAITMAEAANALLIQGRDVAPPSMPAAEPSDPSLSPDEIEALIAANWPAWVGHAHVLEAAAQQAIEAIDAHDTDRLSEAGGTIDAACESCHLQFWYPETR